MHYKLMIFSYLLSYIQAEETVLGAYIYHRHGDRTPKVFPPSTLTDLGYYEVFSSGDFYRSRYLNNGSAFAIYGMSPSIVKNTQLNVQAPSKNPVLQNSAQGFLNGFYPPVGVQLGSQTLRNGTSVEAPLNGLQLIPVNPVNAIAGSTGNDNDVWLQGQTGCSNAIVSSQQYFSSADFAQELTSSASFYESILPVINEIFNNTENSFKNAYEIYDLINLAEIHNTTIPSSNLLTPSVLQNIRVLANTHEYNLGFNTSSPIRAIEGRILAAQIVQALNATISHKSKSPFSMQFGAYDSFLSFFGLAQLSAISDDFTGIVRFASSMTFELVTNSTVSDIVYPGTEDISVRFMFVNGSAAENALQAYPLFGQGQTMLPWNSFVDEMNKFAIGSQEAWCTACGNSIGVCSPEFISGSSAPERHHSGGISKGVAGVIGAFVTLGAILGLEALYFLFSGVRVVHKSRLATRRFSLQNVDSTGKPTSSFASYQ